MALPHASEYHEMVFASLPNDETNVVGWMDMKRITIFRCHMCGRVYTDPGALDQHEEKHELEEEADRREGIWGVGDNGVVLVGNGRLPILVLRLPQGTLYIT
ncbi:zinc finger protein [Striga asiatica]|uniref:Zinc finger protein n=1 Tax=Striga asiatica TaxID=4170 RepID=A0A5A7RBA5_STRAF|nr:zinc finger protein [Striga asiatica]